jgi:DNA-cytosine methyltransferase
MGLETAGMTTVFQCEIDKHCQSVLRHHWPDVPKWDDVSTLTGAHILEQTGGVDVVAWGSPCQDLSVAGKRAGLEGGRSGLFFEGIRIIKELRELSNGKYPRWSIWENVVGALSSNGGADFGQVLYEMDEAGACFSEWAVLDAQYFGIPQRRRRVFVVTCFDPATSERSPDPLLPVAKSLPGNNQKGATTQQATTEEVTEGFGNSGFERWSGQDVAITLSARDYKSPNTVVVECFTPSSLGTYSEGVGTLRAFGGDIGGGSETLIVAPHPKLSETSMLEISKALETNTFQNTN